MKALDELRYTVALWLFILPLRLLRRNVRPGDVHQPSARMAAAIGRHCAEELAQTNAEIAKAERAAADA